MTAAWVFGRAASARRAIAALPSGRVSVEMPSAVAQRSAVVAGHEQPRSAGQDLEFGQQLRRQPVVGGVGLHKGAEQAQRQGFGQEGRVGQGLVERCGHRRGPSEFVPNACMRNTLRKGVLPVWSRDRFRSGCPGSCSCVTSAGPRWHRAGSAPPAERFSSRLAGIRRSLHRPWHPPGSCRFRLAGCPSRSWGNGADPARSIAGLVPERWRSAGASTKSAGSVVEVALGQCWWGR